MTSDEELLRRYRHDRDETAFAAIVRKHGSMVFATCSRTTRNRADAEDAFQATFLVLASRAESVRAPAKLGAWLHGVAVRCARKARDASRRTTSCDAFDSLPAPATVSPEPDLSSVIDEALATIPDAYRAVVVLCHLQGRTRAEAARELGWTEGTLSGRLHRALKLLGERLIAKGVTATGAVLVAVLSARSASASVPTPLIVSTCSAAGLLSAGFPEPGRAVSLASGVLRAMTFRRLKLTALGLGLFGLGAFAVLERAEANPPVREQIKAPVPAEKGAPEKWKKAVEVNHDTPVSAVAVCDDLLVTGGEADQKCNFKPWDPKSGEMVGLKIRGPWFTTSPTMMRFVGDGKSLVAAVPDGIIKYDRKPGGLLVGECFSGVAPLGFADDLGVILLRDRKQPDTVLGLHANLWENKNAMLNPTATVDHTQSLAVKSATVSADGKRLVVANADRVVRVSTADTLKEECQIELLAKTELTALTLSPDGKRLAMIGEKGFAKVFDADKGKEVCELSGHKDRVAAVAFTPDGKRVATACGKTVRVFDAASGKKLSEWEAHADDVTCLAFTPDGKKLVTGSKDKSAKVWERE